MMPAQKKHILILCGFVSLGLGILGIFLPLIPTTPFLLLTATLWLKSSESLYTKLMNHKILGPYILNYLKYKRIPLKTKIGAIITLWLTISLSAIYATDALWLRILLFCIAIGVSIHILSFKTSKK